MFGLWCLSSRHTPVYPDCAGLALGPNPALTAGADMAGCAPACTADEAAGAAADAMGDMPCCVAAATSAAAALPLYGQVDHLSLQAAQYLRFFEGVATLWQEQEYKVFYKLHSAFINC